MLHWRSNVARAPPRPLNGIAFDIKMRWTACIAVMSLVVASAATAAAGRDAERRAQSFLALTKAASAGDLKTVEALLRNGANPRHPPEGPSEAEYFSQSTDPVQGAAEHGFDEVVKVLLAHAADPNWQCCSGETALVMAAEANHLRTVKVLLGGGADPLLMGDGGPALFGALSSGNVRIAAVLLLPTLIAAAPVSIPLIAFVGVGGALLIRRRRAGRRNARCPPTA